MRALPDRPTDTPEAPFDLLEDDNDRLPSFAAVASMGSRIRPLPALPPGELQAMFRGATRP